MAYLTLDSKRDARERSAQRRDRLAGNRASLAVGLIKRLEGPHRGPIQTFQSLLDHGRNVVEAQALTQELAPTAISLAAFRMQGAVPPARPLPGRGAGSGKASGHRLEGERPDLHELERASGSRTLSRPCNA